MAKKQKYYVIWEGHQKGIFDTWAETEKNIKGFPNAQYKSFESRAEAEAASKKNYWASINPKSNKTLKPSGMAGQFILPSISVDAACAGNPGILEYQGVNTATKEVLFKRGPFPVGTVNLGEFLAIVHGLSYLKKLDCPFPLYRILERQLPGSAIKPSRRIWSEMRRLLSYSSSSTELLNG
jgi:ribonuclease HI